MSIRDYDDKRVQRLALAMWKSMLVELRDDQGTVFIPSAEVFDAMALLGGMMLSAGPAARSPTKLREITTDFGKSVAKRARQAQEQGGQRIFDIVLDEETAH